MGRPVSAMPMPPAAGESTGQGQRWFSRSEWEVALDATPQFALAYLGDPPQRLSAHMSHRIRHPRALTCRSRFSVVIPETQWTNGLHAQKRVWSGPPNLGISGSSQEAAHQPRWRATGFPRHSIRIQQPGFAAPREPRPSPRLSSGSSSTSTCRPYGMSRSGPS